MEITLFENNCLTVSTGEWDCEGQGETVLESVLKIAEDLGFIEIAGVDELQLAEFCKETEPLILLNFARKVDARAQELMIADGKVSGKHYAAMRLILKEKGIEFGR